MRRGSNILFGHYLEETAQLINKVLNIDFGDPNYDPPKFNLYVLIKKFFILIPNLIIFSYLNLYNRKSNIKIQEIQCAKGQPPPIIKLKLGGEKLENFILFDEFNPTADIAKRDVEKGLPFSDNTVEEMVIDGYLVYVKDLEFVMSEIHRISLPDTIIKISVPSFENDLNFSSPRQLRIFNAHSLDYFIKSDENSSKRFDLISLKENNDGKTIEFDLKVRKKLNKMDPRKIDLGCGPNKREGCLGIDIMLIDGVDIVRDIDKRGLPFSDSAVEYIYTCHFLEHTDNFIFIMNEIFRVCCANALVEIIVPTIMSPHALADPSHKRLFNFYTFRHYFEGDYIDADKGYAGICKGYRIVSQSGLTSLHVKLKVVK